VEHNDNIILYMDSNYGSQYDAKDAAEAEETRRLEASLAELVALEMDEDEAEQAALDRLFANFAAE
jgi:hypothetical protein